MPQDADTGLTMVAYDMEIREFFADGDFTNTPCAGAVIPSMGYAIAGQAPTVPGPLIFSSMCAQSLPQMLHCIAILGAHCSQGCQLQRGPPCRWSSAMCSLMPKRCAGLTCRGQQDLMRFTNKVVPNPAGYFPPAGPKNSGHGVLPDSSICPSSIDGQVKQQSTWGQLLPGQASRQRCCLVDKGLPVTALLLLLLLLLLLPIAKSCIHRHRWRHLCQSSTPRGQRHGWHRPRLQVQPCYVLRLHIILLQAPQTAGSCFATLTLR